MDRFVPKGDRYMRGGRPILDADDIRHLWDRAKASEDIVDQAQNNAEDSKREFLTSLGYKRVVFT